METVASCGRKLLWEEEIQRARFKAEKLALQELGLRKVLERHCLLAVPHSSALVSSKIVDQAL